MSPARPRYADLAVALLLVLVVLLRWHGINSAFWRADDPALLLHALQSPGLAAFFDPADWRPLSPSNLTPWISASFKLDLALAGLRPAAFYTHQLVSAILVALAAYALGRQAALPPAWAAGQRNEPANVARYATLLAELRGMAVDELIAITTANARAALPRLPLR